uniref:Laminin EGF-like domain-containing protein n=1 Tax=Magallana gigas TaxID=29159 RepID=A0A8W8P720_MAGGI
MSSLSEFAYINICEIHVNITGCDIGFYGENCTKCPDNCLNDDCRFQIGHCFDCIDGFNGDMCEECSFTDYGPNCNTSCSKDCQHGLCNHTTGHCLACAEDRFGNLCENKLPANGGY